MNTRIKGKSSFGKVAPFLTIGTLLCGSVASADMAGPPAYAQDPNMKSSAEQLRDASYTDANEKKLLSGYTTGWEFCEANKDVISKDEGHWVDVPVSYSDPSKGTTPIYAYFRGGYDKSRPTVIIFDGGPGSNTHDGDAFPRMSLTFNELHFDQRGIGCSRPATLATYRDPSFYSSLNTAKDADRIRQALVGIDDKVSVYGDSYGTMLATVYASVFAKNTRALVLEGTYFRHDLSVDHGREQKHLKQVYDELPTCTQQAMAGYFDESKKTWVASYTQMLTYNFPGIYNVLPILLKASFPEPGKVDEKQVAKQMDPNGRDSTFNGLNAFDMVNFSVLECKEKQDGVIDLPMYYHDSSGKTVEFKSERVNTFDQLGTTANCKSLGAKPNKKPYSADRFPTPVPVTYYQGSWDTATDMDGAKRHWQTVPEGPKQVLLAQGGSHMSHVLAISKDYRLSDTAVEAQLRVFDQALQGSFANQADVEQINTIDAAHTNAANVKWVLNPWTK